jgi:hypothetical protein
VAALMRRLALPIAITSFAVNVIMLIGSSILWWQATQHRWVESIVFISHVSMLALVFAAVSGTAAAIAGILALTPTD